MSPVKPNVLHEAGSGDTIGLRISTSPHARSESWPELSDLSMTALTVRDTSVRSELTSPHQLRSWSQIQWNRVQSLRAEGKAAALTRQSDSYYAGVTRFFI